MVDVNAQIEAVTRSLQTTDIDGQPTRVQSLTQDYPAAIGDVWEAMTTVERIQRWFLPISGDLRLGGKYQLEGNAGGEILECVPPAEGVAHYRVSWVFGGGADTWLTVRLSSLGADRTRVELEHVARVADIPEEMWTQFGPAGTGIGWDSALLGLSGHLGAIQHRITPEEGMAWMLSDEGKQFSRLSADAWAQAHEADGADPETAARAADATYAMYTQAPGE